LSPLRDDVEEQDARNMEKVDANSIDFIFWHPPYWQLVKYSEKNSDLSRMGWDAFLEAIDKIIDECYRVLKKDKYLCILTGDCVKDKRFYPISRKIANSAERLFDDCGVAIKTTEGAKSLAKGKTIWAEVAASNNLKIEHDFVLIFNKNASDEAT